MSAAPFMYITNSPEKTRMSEFIVKPKEISFGFTMNSLILVFSGEFVMYMKGAADIVLNHCSRVWYSNGDTDLTEESKESIIKQQDLLADHGERVLAVCF